VAVSFIGGGNRSTRRKLSYKYINYIKKNKNNMCNVFRLKHRGSEPTTTNNSMSPQTETTRLETAANIYDVENQYDEISIEEEIPRKQEEYHHLEFIPSKTSNHPAYGHTEDATYDNAVY
jgi:hypothetical protein